ncbi:60S acidic ribosomal protein P0 (RLA0) [Vairimorpha necatrix]|uniref:Large ribosomal subunit protein uL10 n=1 Tax=Vairimorpha necatrix TaxID=6039 RepID=A0AAX4JBJ3_9MICR
MTVKESKVRKQNTYEKAKECFKTFNKFALVSMDNIVSNQLKEMKRAWGSSSVFLTGKNTAIRRALKELNKEEMLDKVKGNISLVFFKDDVKKIKEVIDEFERGSVAKVGDVSQSDVWIKAHVTGMTSDKTGYFQTLGIPTKITKGKIEIMQDFLVLNAGDKVGPSQANLLALINIKPFRYKMKIFSIYEDGEFYCPSLIDVSEEDIKGIYSQAIRDVAMFSLGSEIITQASVPYEISKAFRSVLNFGFGAEIKINDSPLPMVY